MDIQFYASGAAPREAGASGSRGISGAGASFQDLLRQTASGETAELSDEFRGLPGKARLSEALYQAKLDMLEKMKRGREKEEEEEAWEDLMEYVDAWIETLREEGDLERTARATAALEARRTARPVKRKDPGDFLLEQLQAALCGQE